MTLLIKFFRKRFRKRRIKFKPSLATIEEVPEPPDYTTCSHIMQNPQPLRRFPPSTSPVTAVVGGGETTTSNLSGWTTSTLENIATLNNNDYI